ncbi:MAG: hypothetical protein KGY76_02715 [Candidatus Thermoplasmatota archaeon]|nr:hypothetical protein [Candidatus Thermoplasmatota archaeon]
MSDEGNWSSDIDTGTYEETVFSKWMTLILGIITTIFFSIWIYDIFVGWNWSVPPLSWFWLGMFLFMLGITINFAKLSIKIDSEGISLGFGILRKKIPWQRVEDSYVDEASALRYGGWGLRFTRVEGKWRTAFNAVAGPRVVVSLNKGFVREIVFSTKDTEKAIQTIKRHLRKRGKKIE